MQPCSVPSAGAWGPQARRTGLFPLPTVAPSTSDSHCPNLGLNQETVPGLGLRKLHWDLRSPGPR